MRGEGEIKVLQVEEMNGRTWWMEDKSKRRLVPAFPSLRDSGIPAVV